jgi:tryptophanyl-tRNA synthetase
VSSEEKIVLSGMRSTGKLHLGHYFGTLRNWVDLQDRHTCYFFAADWHALTSDYADTSRVAESTLDAVADWIAAGIDPERSVVFVQSMVPEHAELHLILSMITPLGWLERVPTYKEQLREVAGKDLGTYGFLGYPVLQTADIVLYRAHFVPVGEDQASHLELSREITRRFNGLYGDVFPEPKALFTPTPKVPGLDGRKMSKSYDNAINLSDPPEVIREKCKSMFTDPARLRRSDPGRPEVCNLFEFHKLLSPPEVRDRVAVECRAAQIGCVDDKKLLAEQMIAFLEPMQRRRAELLRDRCSRCSAPARRRRASGRARRSRVCGLRWGWTTAPCCGGSCTDDGHAFAAGRPAAAGIVAGDAARLRGTPRPPPAPHQAQRGRHHEHPGRHGLRPVPRVPPPDGGAGPRHRRRVHLRGGAPDPAQVEDAAAAAA